MYKAPYVISDSGPITIESECVSRATIDGNLQDAMESWRHVSMGIDQVQVKPPVKQFIVVDGVVYINAAFIKENTL